MLFRLYWINTKHDRVTHMACVNLSDGNPLTDQNNMDIFIYTTTGWNKCWLYSIFIKKHFKQCFEFQISTSTFTVIQHKGLIQSTRVKPCKWRSYLDLSPHWACSLPSPRTHPFATPVFHNLLDAYRQSIFCQSCPPPHYLFLSSNVSMRHTFYYYYYILFPMVQEHQVGKHLLASTKSHSTPMHCQPTSCLSFPPTLSGSCRENQWARWRPAQHEDVGWVTDARGQQGLRLQQAVDMGQAICPPAHKQVPDAQKTDRRGGEENGWEKTQAFVAGNRLHSVVHSLLWGCCSPKWKLQMKQKKGWPCINVFICTDAFRPSPVCKWEDSGLSFILDKSSYYKGFVRLG